MLLWGSSEFLLEETYLDSGEKELEAYANQDSNRETADQGCGKAQTPRSDSWQNENEKQFGVVTHVLLHVLGD